MGKDMKIVTALAGCALVLGSMSGCCCCKKGSDCVAAVAANDSDTTPQDTAILIDVLANDTAGSDGQLSIASVVSPTTMGGTAVISGGQILYTPPPASAGGTNVVKNISTGHDDITGEKYSEATPDTDYVIVAGGTGGHVGATPLTRRGPFPLSYAVDADSTTAAWLLLVGTGPSGQEVPQGTYFWQTTVDATGFDPTTMQIVGFRVAADDVIIAIYVNDVLVVDPPVDSLGAAFVSLGDVGLGAFQSGVNTIRFVVDNTPPPNTDMGLRVEGTVQAAPGASVAAPFTDTFTYTISNGCGGASTATVSVNVTEPGNTLAALAASPARVLVVNNSSAEITVYVGDAEVDVLQPRGTTIAPRSVASGANQQVRVEALSADPQSNGTTTTTTNLEPDGAYTITYTDTGDGNRIITVAK